MKSEARKTGECRVKRELQDMKSGRKPRRMMGMPDEMRFTLHVSRDTL